MAWISYDCPTLVFLRRTDDELSGAYRRCHFSASSCSTFRSKESERVCFQVISPPFESANCHLTSCLVSQSFLAQIEKMADECNYTSYLEKFLTYPPPPAPFPLPGTSVEFDPGCDVFSLIVEAALLLNPAFDVYRIFDMVC
jgi:hypothetical protein